MDLESEYSALESVEDNGLTPIPDAISNHNGDDTDVDGDNNSSEVKANGACSNEIDYVGTSGNVDTNTLPLDTQVKEGVVIEQASNSVNSPTKSPAGASPSTTKGFGLKKWRRIRRDVVKDASYNEDGGKLLKRGLSGSGNPTKSTNLLLVEIKQNSEAFVGSANELRNVIIAEEFVARGSGFDSRFAIGATGMDSENSEDWSSKSSTAASAPRTRYDLPAVLGYAWEKNRVKNLSGKSVGSSAQRAQQGKGRVESSKKHRGERIKIEKENSHSSMGSDSRSSNFFFMQGAYSVTSNRKHSGISMNFDGENSDEAHAGEQNFSEEVQTGYGEGNAGEVEDLLLDELAAESSWEGKEEKSENHQPSTDQDPLVESVLTLQSVQKALESEVKKLGEIGKANGVPLDSSFADLGINESSLSDQLDAENIAQCRSWDSQVLSLTESVKFLQNSLEEAKAMLKVKDLKVAELEATLNGGTSSKEESANTIDLQQEKSNEIETNLEGLFKQKIEAEIEYLALTRTIQKLRVAAGDQVTLFEEQEGLAREQVQMLNKLEEAEGKAAMLKTQLEELEKHCGDILGTEEVLKMQRRVCKVTSCFSIQLILLILVFWLLALQLSSHSQFVVPT